MLWWKAGGNKQTRKPSSSVSSSSSKSHHSPKQLVKRIGTQHNPRNLPHLQLGFESPKSDTRFSTDSSASSRGIPVSPTEFGGFFQTSSVFSTSPAGSSGWRLPSPTGTEICFPSVASSSSMFDVESDRIHVVAKGSPHFFSSRQKRSPIRVTTRDSLSSCHDLSERNQSRSLVENHSPNQEIAGLSYQGLLGRTLPSPDNASARSPQRMVPVINSKSPGRQGSSAIPKTNVDISSARNESSDSMFVHPLPLPPTASPTRLSPSLHQAGALPSLPLRKGVWQKKQLIGYGTYGRVYLALNSQTGATCAMKEVTLIPDDPRSAECLKQLEQEINFLSQFKHPNIVQYYGCERVDDCFNIYLEYVHRGSILKVIQELGGSIPEEVVSNFTRHILCGLVYLHRRKIVHRDIKGANLLVSNDGVVKLADFGMAKHLNRQASTLSLKGSPYWMAPEVLMQKVTGHELAVDIWSLGCTIIEMYTGKPPWGDLSGVTAMFNVTRNKIPPIPNNLSANGKDFLRRCFQCNPSDRPTAIELLGHPFLGSSLPKEIGSRHQDVLDMRKLRSSPRATNWNPDLQAPLPRIHASNCKKPSTSEDGHGPVEHTKSKSTPCGSPRTTLENFHSQYPQRADETAENIDAGVVGKASSVMETIREYNYCVSNKF